MSSVVITQLLGGMSQNLLEGWQPLLLPNTQQHGKAFGPVKVMPYSFVGKWKVSQRPIGEERSPISACAILTQETPLGLQSTANLHLVHNNICSKPIFTKFNRLSKLVANGHKLILLIQNLQHLPTYQTSIAFPLGRLTCSRRCQLALDLTARGTDFTPASALSGRLQ